MTITPLFKKKIIIEETKINLVSDINITNNNINNINSENNENNNNNNNNNNKINKNNTFNTYNLNDFIKNQRNQLKKYISENPLFAKTLKPYTSYKSSEIPKIIELMINGSKIANVGPTATLAGTIAELSLDYLIKNGSKCSIVDNGGDIAFLNNNAKKKVVLGIYAGDSPLSGKIGLEFKLEKKNQKFGVCSSSGSVGYSISYGRSDSVTVIANQASIADGLASAIGNNVNGKLDKDAVENGLIAAEGYMEHFIGALIIVGESIGTIGKVPKIIETENININSNFKDKY